MQAIDDSASAVPTKRKPIWAYALLAGLIAIVWAAIGALGSISDAPLPDGTPRGEGRVAGFHVGYAFASALLASVVTWLLFHVLVFRRRLTSLGKSFVVLSIIFVSAFAVAASARFVVVAASAAKQEAFSEWSAQITARAASRRREFSSDIAPLARDGEIFDEIRNRNDVDERLVRVRHALSRLRTFSSALQSDVQSGREALNAIDVLSAREKQGALEDYHRSVSPMTRSLDLQEQAWTKREALLAELVNNKDAWTVSNGAVLFYKESDLAQFRAKAAELDAILLELRNMHDAQAAANETQRKR